MKRKASTVSTFSRAHLSPACFQHLNRMKSKLFRKNRFTKAITEKLNHFKLSENAKQKLEGLSHFAKGMLFVTPGVLLIFVGGSLVFFPQATNSLLAFLFVATGTLVIYLVKRALEIKKEVSRVFRSIEARVIIQKTPESRMPEGTTIIDSPSKKVVVH